MSEFSEKIGMEAGEVFKSGFNCCESLVETFRRHGGVDIDDNAFRLCSGFGGGIGHARDLCGALSGCVMVVSALAGRNHPSEKPLSEVYPLTGEFHKRFSQEFGSSHCGDLMHYEFGTKEHKSNCLKLVNNTARLLAEFLEEKKLLNT